MVLSSAVDDMSMDVRASVCALIIGEEMRVGAEIVAERAKPHANQ
jgi:hypothetical protein